jgi:hypothetical protein
MNQRLPVQKCGSYDVSIALSIDDLSRLDTNVFQLAKATSKILTRHYPTGYGFCVCILRTDGLQHPIAYVSHSKRQLDVSARCFLCLLFLFVVVVVG